MAVSAAKASSKMPHVFDVAGDEDRIAELNAVKKMAYRAPEVPPMLFASISEILVIAEPKFSVLMRPRFSSDTILLAPATSVVPQSPSPRIVSRRVISGSS